MPAFFATLALWKILWKTQMPCQSSVPGATPRKTKSKRKPPAVTPSSTGRYFTAVIERLIYQEDNSSRREEGSRVRSFAQFLGQHTPSQQQRRPRKIRIIWQFRLQRNTVYRRYT